MDHLNYVRDPDLELTARQADELLNNELLQRILDELTAQIHKRWEVELLDENREMLWRDLKAIRSLRGQIRTHIEKWMKFKHERDGNQHKR